ncbi:MAG: ABC transporter permease [Deltaproteobacteria bacterium]|nr:ABC transporter permease [Deltaproteobacteria bacterium]
MNMKTDVNPFSLIMRWATVPFRFKALFWGFMISEIRGRFAGSIGGVLWSLLTPLANLLIYIFVFSLILKIRLQPMETGTDSFAVFFLAGLLPWGAFAESLSEASSLFLQRAAMITKVAFPLELLPMIGVLVPFFLHGLGFAMYLGYLIIKGYFHVVWLWLPVVIVIHMVFALGMVTLISSLSVFLRDIQQFIGTVLTLWFFSTPIIYPLSMVPDPFSLMMKFNPMYPFIELYRRILLQHTLSWDLIGTAGGLAAVVFTGGVLFFSRAKYAFADVL